MKVLTKRKKIVVPFRGYISPLGVSGPIEIPYYDKIERIRSLVMVNIPVYEVLNDGSKVKLDVANYDQENASPELSSTKVTYESNKKPSSRDGSVTIISETGEEKATTLLKQSLGGFNPAITKNFDSKVQANKVQVGKDERIKNKKRVNGTVDIADMK